MLSNQSPTSYLFHRFRGRCLQGRRANRGPLRTGDGQGEAWGEGEGERDLVRALALLITKRTSFGSDGRLRLEDFRMVRPRPELRSGRSEQGAGEEPSPMERSEGEGEGEGLLRVTG